MPQRPKTPCKFPSCPNLATEYCGYCADHQDQKPKSGNEALRELSLKKSAAEKRFYSGSRWTKISRLHRVREPLCQPCKKKGLITMATLTHHDPPLKELWAKGLNPYSEKYLASSCNNCHMEELRKKRS